ncbi:MAG: D-alanine--D-alanine ligase [Planctomycetota bacterium]
MKVAICYNLKREESGYLSAEYDGFYTVEAISKALQSRGAETLLVEANEDAFEILRKIKPQIDIVFNIAEGIRGNSRESHIPAVLEFLNIHYAGPGIDCTANALNKSLTKKLLQRYRIRTAPWAVISSTNRNGLDKLRMPVVIKPNHEGSSIGIEGGKSLSNSVRSIIRRAKEIEKKYNQPALVEEFLPGAEITVGLFGEKEPEVLPFLEIYTDMYPKATGGLVTKNAKTIFEKDNYSGQPRNLSVGVKRKIKKMVVEAYTLLNCRDFGRVDIRIDRDGEPCVMELNPIPGISPRIEDVSYFTKICRSAGISYEEMIWKIVNNALKRKNK